MFPQLVKKRKELAAKVQAHEEYLSKGKIGEDYNPSESELKVSSTVFAEEVRKQVKEIEDVRKEVDDLAVIHQADVNLKTINKTSLKHDPEAQGGGLHDPGAKSGDDKPFKSIGQMFVESKAFKDYEQGSGKGPVSKTEMTRNQMKALFATGGGSGTGSTGWDPQDVRTSIVSMYPTRPAPAVIDYFPQIPTSQTAVVYMEETVFSEGDAAPGGGGVFQGAAEERREAGRSADGSALGDYANTPQYAEADLKLQQRSQDVEKIAIWLPVTDEQLEDVAQIESYIDQRLRLMINQRVDYQILQGNGAKPHLLGTANIDGAQTVMKGDDSSPDAIYKAMVEVMADGYADPGVIFIHPRQWRDIVLLKTADGQYIWGHPSMPGPKTLWGVPVVTTTAIQQNSCITGDFQMHAFFSLKRGIDMQISNSHSTFFTQGIQAIRMDMRGCVVHIRPKAFAHIDLAA